MKSFKNSHFFLWILLLAGSIYFLSAKNRSSQHAQVETFEESKPVPNRKLASNPNLVSTVRQKITEDKTPAPQLRFKDSKEIVEWLRQQDDSKYFDFVENENLGALQSTNYTQIYIFQQTYKGFKVFDQNVRLILKKDTNELIRVKSKLSEIPDLKSDRYMSLNLTKKRVTSNLGIDPKTISSLMVEPEIYVQENKSYLIWRFAQKESLDKDADWTLFVDAQNGNILRRESNRIH